MRTLAKRAYLGLLQAKSALLPAPRPDGRILVLAPHPDDETLGCGGTIIQARRRGARVHVAFVTDGAASHPGAAVAGLEQTRRQEALAACAALGVDAANVSFMDFPDGDLSGREAALQAAIEKLLAIHQPDELYMPIRFDGHPDHLQTRCVASRAARSTGRRLTLYECPIWALNHWPLVQPHGFGINRYFLAKTARAMANCMRYLNTRRDVGDVLAQKRAALARHKTQFNPLSSLDDVSGGEWLENFFSGSEFFFMRDIG